MHKLNTRLCRRKNFKIVKKPFLKNGIRCGPSVGKPYENFRNYTTVFHRNLPNSLCNGDTSLIVKKRQDQHKNKTRNFMYEHSPKTLNKI